MKSRQQGWQEKQKASGNCTSCGKRRDGKSGWHCNACQKKIRESKRMKGEKKAAGRPLMDDPAYRTIDQILEELDQVIKSAGKERKVRLELCRRYIAGRKR